MWDFEKVYSIIIYKEHVLQKLVCYLSMCSFNFLCIYLPKSKETVLRTFIKYIIFLVSYLT